MDPYQSEKVTADSVSAPELSCDFCATVSPLLGFDFAVHLPCFDNCFESYDERSYLAAGCH